MDEDKEFDEGFLALLVFNLVLSLISTIEIFFTSIEDNLVNTIDFSYVEFPSNDFITLLVLFIINFVFLLFYTGQSFKFRKSANLTYRQGERWGFAVKSAIFNGLYSVHQRVYETEAKTVREFDIGWTLHNVLWGVKSIYGCVHRTYCIENSDIKA